MIIFRLSIFGLSTWMFNVKDSSKMRERERGQGARSICHQRLFERDCFSRDVAMAEKKQGSGDVSAHNVVITLMISYSFIDGGTALTRLPIQRRERLPTGVMSGIFTARQVSLRTSHTCCSESSPILRTQQTM